MVHELPAGINDIVAQIANTNDKGKIIRKNKFSVLSVHTVKGNSIAVKQFLQDGQKEAKREYDTYINLVQFCKEHLLPVHYSGGDKAEVPRLYPSRKR